MAGLRLHLHQRLAVAARLASVALVTLAACNKAPAEPDVAPASSAASAPAVAPLLWDAPGAWARLDVPASGARKAAYRVDKAGNDKEEAEANVFFYGTGAKGDPAVSFKEWFDQFDGNVGADAAREKIQVRGLEVETVEVSGTYKIGLTPPMRGKKASPVQMVKNKWRLYGAVVKTPDRGNWFFKLAGPDETVQAAKSAFRTMLESAR
jgi:hypothetical protein